MKPVCLSVLLLLSGALILSPLQGKQSNASSSSSASANPKVIEVKGYTKKDGTVVQPYKRTVPDGDRSNNLGSQTSVRTTTHSSSSSSVDRSAGQSGTSSIGLKPEAASADSIKVGFAKDEVLKAAGEPKIKSSSKWLYDGIGWVHFSKEGTVTSIVQR